MSLLLGIDIGTTSIKASLVQREQYRVVEEHSEQSNVTVVTGTEKTDEQDPVKILQTLHKLVEKFPLDQRRKVTGIGISGQMHGITLWNRTLRLNDILQAQSYQSCNDISSLITWRDGRCSDEFLSTLPKTPNPVSTGYGCCTLFWLNTFDPDLLRRYDCAGTIMDLAVFLLCQLDTVVMSDHNANSWGFFDIARNQWETEILNNNGFPVNLLPKVVQVPCIAGSLTQSWQEIPAGIPVGVAMGDLQCSVYSVEPAQGEAVLNMGTASQISVIKPLPTPMPDSRYPPSIMEVPYFNGSNLLVAASLTGGNAFAAVADIFKEFLQYTDSSLSDNEIYSILIQVAERKLNTTLECDPVLLGERHDSNKRGSARNISSENVSLGDIVSSVLKGTVGNLKSMMPNHILETLEVTQVIGCGSALYRNQVLCEYVKMVFGLPLVMKCESDAPLGAGIAIGKILD